MKQVSVWIDMANMAVSEGEGGPIPEKMSSNKVSKMVMEDIAGDVASIPLDDLKESVHKVVMEQVLLGETEFTAEELLKDAVHRYHFLNGLFED